MIKKWTIIFLISFYYSILQSFVSDYSLQILMACFLGSLYTMDLKYKHFQFSFIISMLVIYIQDPFQWQTLEQFSNVFNLPSAITLVIVVVVSSISLVFPPYLISQILSHLYHKKINVI